MLSLWTYFIYLEAVTVFCIRHGYEELLNYMSPQLLSFTCTDVAISRLQAGSSSDGQLVKPSRDENVPVFPNKNLSVNDPSVEMLHYSTGTCNFPPLDIQI